MDSFDRETGEVADSLPTVAERALATGRTERQSRRDEIRGVGQVSLYQKLAAAYKELSPVIGHNKLASEKTGQRGDYTSYDAIIAKVQPKLLEHGILIRHSCGHVLQMGEAASKTYWLPVSTYLIDVDTGDVVECTVPVPIVRPDPHGCGSALSYGRRYGLLSSLGFATGDASEDDDAESAMPRNISDEGDDAEIIREIEATKTEAEANKLKATYYKRFQELQPEAYTRVKEAFQLHVKKLRSAPASEPAPKKAKKIAEPVA